MIWRNDAERASACNAILRGVHMGMCFGADGDATAHGLSLQPSDPESDFGCKSHGKQVMLRFAWDVWNETGEFNMAEALRCLDETNCTIIGRFFLAYASPDHGLMAEFIRAGGVEMRAVKTPGEKWGNPPHGHPGHFCTPDADCRR